MMQRTTKLTLIIATVLALGGGVSVLAIAGSDAPEPPAPKPLATTIDAQLVASFAIFDRDADADDRIPYAVSQALAHATTIDGANADLSRRSASNEVGTLFVTAGNDSVCTNLADENGAGGGCVPVALALTGKSVTTEQLTDGVVVSGIVPDGVESVTVTLSDGTAQSAPVESNGYIVKVAGAPKTLDYVDADGAQSVAIPYVLPEGRVVAGE
jgi:hypothetical protein